MTFLVILVGTLVHAFCHRGFIRQLTNCFLCPKSYPALEEPLPKAVVILCLRGNDPYLQTCLSNLLQQDYPNYALHIVVDSVSDPALPIVRQAQSDFPHASCQVTILRTHYATCSLKISSIIQAMSEIPDDCQIVAFADADSITRPDWLRHLVRPFSDPSVGCSSGVRWFAPAELTVGSRVRCYWNLFAAPMMHFHCSPWGGSMAIRRSVLESGLLDEWSRMFCEDVHTGRHVRKRGLKSVCVPEATLVNEETISVQSCFHFFNRQMLISRLYHDFWWALVLLMVLGTVLRFTHLGLIAGAFVRGDWQYFFAFILIYPIIVCVTRFETQRLDRAIRETVGNNIARVAMPDFGIYFLTELLSLASMVLALTTRSIRWRGIQYKVSGPENIELQHYHAFVPAPAISKLNAESVL